MLGSGVVHFSAFYIDLYSASRCDLASRSQGFDSWRVVWSTLLLILAKNGAFKQEKARTDV